MKNKETIEEAARKYSLNGSWQCPVSFEDGAKWQQERMYSEEDLRKAYNDGIANLDYDERYGFSTKITEQQWFEQFKKK